MPIIGVSKLFLASAAVLTMSCPSFGAPAKSEKANVQAISDGPAVLWRDPVDIASRDLYYGPGGKRHEPKGPFMFDKEDMKGSNPKFDVVDQDGVKWTVKMGDEARPETVAARLVWAVGYFANEDYFLPVLCVQNMHHLRRGNRFVSPDGTVYNVRLKRHLKSEKKISTWKWANDPFTGTQEWNGLRVLMAIINNWDLKDANNAIYQVGGERPERLYLASDLGAAFGTTGLTWNQRGDLQAYIHSKWIRRITPTCIDFNVPSWPAANRWIGRNIPRADAKWLGHMLAQLSPHQIRDAFRAAGYASQEIEAFSQVVERRIAELKQL
jgi:hypothetical protein